MSTQGTWWRKHAIISLLLQQEQLEEESGYYLSWGESPSLPLCFGWLAIRLTLAGGLGPRYMDANDRRESTTLRLSLTVGLMTTGIHGVSRHTMITYNTMIILPDVIVLMLAIGGKVVEAARVADDGPDPESLPVDPVGRGGWRRG